LNVVCDDFADVERLVRRSNLALLEAIVDEPPSASA